jgi:hypothetical protein
MADFLSSLLARSLGAAEVLQPRRASLFETGLVTGPRTEALDEPPVVEEEPPMVVLRGVRRMATRAIESVAAPPATVESTHEAHSPRIPVASEAQREVSERIRPTMTTPRPELAARGPEGPPPRVPLPPRARADESRPARPPRPLDSEVPRQTGAHFPVHVEARRSPADPPTSAYQSASEMLSAGTASLSPRPLATPAAIIVRPRPAAHPGLAVPDQMKSASLEPTIHVTIGRIEVRAIPAAPAPPAKGRPASPVMTLDEYLRERTKRSRR